MVMLAISLPDTEALVSAMGPQVPKMENCLSNLSCVLPFSFMFQLIAWLMTNHFLFDPVPPIPQV